MKTLSILFFALFLASCSKENVVPLGEYVLYNSQARNVTMNVAEHSISFYRNDSLIGSSEYVGSLFDGAFSMPANVWENDNVVGQWSQKYAFLEFTYVAANHDTSLVKYIPTETYVMDWVRE